MRDAGIIHYALFWNGSNGLRRAYFVNNCLQSATMNRRFWISYRKWYKFCNNNLSFVLGSKGGTLKLVNPKQEDWASIQLLNVSLSRKFLVYFAEMSSYFSVKTSKRKVRKYLKCMKEFLRRFDLANGNYLSVFLGIFARIVKVTHFAQVAKFRERANRKMHPRKVGKNNREPTFFCQQNSKTKFIVPFPTQQEKQKVYLPFLFVAFVFRIGSLPMRLQRMKIG